MEWHGTWKAHVKVRNEWRWRWRWIWCCVVPAGLRSTRGFDEFPFGVASRGTETTWCHQLAGSTKYLHSLMEREAKKKLNGGPFAYSTFIHSQLLWHLLLVIQILHPELVLWSIEIFCIKKVSLSEWLG